MNGQEERTSVENALVEALFGNTFGLRLVFGVLVLTWALLTAKVYYGERRLFPKSMGPGWRANQLAITWRLKNHLPVSLANGS